MNTASLRKYAPQARRDFLRAVSDRAAKVGLREGGAHVQVEASGAVAIMGGQSYPRAFKAQRDALAKKVADSGFAAVMEEAAYVWFNRFMALRYMEVHGYLDHGFRALSHPAGGSRPELLERAADLSLPGLQRAEVVAMLLDGGKDEELYRRLLLTQCQALHQAMPFLFEHVDDATELLLPDNLLASDSLVRRLVAEIPEEDWRAGVEIVGWLYQFYISEEKARVDAAVKKGKAVKPAEIPAKTQIFTPNWIVKYMVQNSLGRLWLDIEPTSTLKAGWEYWVEPAQQEPEVEAELARLAAETRAKRPTPETITFVDPCAGSGHILAEAYDTLKGMYQERGYARRDIPRLILERNLYGLEIDPRAAQMAGFALLMKARADDRTILQNPPRLNVLALRPSGDLDADEALAALVPREVAGLGPTSLAPILDGQGSLGDAPRAASPELRGAVCDLIDLFEDAETLGSLLLVPPKLAAALPDLRARLTQAPPDLLSGPILAHFAELVRQAELLAMRANVAVTNPPYLSVSSIGEPLKSWSVKKYPAAKSDLWAMFMERCRLGSSDYFALVTMHAWMFLSTYEDLRKGILTEDTVVCLAHLGSRAFREISGEVVQTAAYVVRDRHLPLYRGVYQRMVSGTDVEKEAQLRAGLGRYDNTLQSEFADIPGSPIAYWVSEKVRRLFSQGTPVGKLVHSGQGLGTRNDAKFVRYWWEVSRDRIGLLCGSSEQALASGCRWFLYNKGGTFRRWYGNLEWVVDWENDGQRICDFIASRYGSASKRVQNRRFYFQPSVSWSDITSGRNSFRAYPPGTIHSDPGPAAFSDRAATRALVLAFANSSVAEIQIALLSPTVHFSAPYFDKLCIPEGMVLNMVMEERVTELVRLAKEDWDERETSIEFAKHPCERHRGSDIRSSLNWWSEAATERISTTLDLETKNNKEFIQAAGLVGVLEPDSPSETCVWLRPDEELFARTFLSFSVGVLMGRWEHDRGTVDDDGILPVTEENWFGVDDTAVRVAEFVGCVWPREGLTDNLRVLADGLGAGADAAPLDAIRRYLATGFYKDHLQTYRKRPIYWLFSSGKERAFGALVYLHRYNAGTLSRMRMNYVVPLQQRMNARIDGLAADIAASATTSERRRREKEREVLLRQAVELRAFDEKLRHYADQRIELDLDDGVRVNYAKFGDLLAESAKIVGEKDE
jgi:hypothetical protein